MNRGAIVGKLRSRWTVVALAMVFLVAGVAIILNVTGSSTSFRTSSQMIAGTPEGAKPVRLDTTLFLPHTTPAPAVLLAHGFGGSKSSVIGDARTLAEHGYVVLTYTARGFGRSGGLIHLDAPGYEIHDARLMVSYLASLTDVLKKGGKPQIAVAGGSYGGALALLLAGSDKRIQAVAADITWNDLSQALFPNAASNGPGVFKKLWAGTLFGSAFGPGGTGPCGRFAADICAGYQYAARTGLPNGSLTRLLRASSPASVLSKITAPTLLTQGEQDSLFSLGQADANARGIAAAGTPVRVVWRSGGHDDSSSGNDTLTSAVLNWFGRAFGGGIHGTQPFQISEQGGSVSAASGEVTDQNVQAPGYPGIGGTKPETRTIAVTGRAQPVAAPAGGAPAAISSIPGLSGALSQFGRVTDVLGTFSQLPGQGASFSSAPLKSSVLVAGSPTVRITVAAKTSADVTLFASLRDASGGGTSVLPSQLVAPLRLTRMVPGVPRTVTVQLPGFVKKIAAGHRLILDVATTDFAYQLPQDARAYTISLQGGSADITLPTTSGVRVLQSGQHPFAWLIVGVLALLLAGGTVAVVIRRRRRSLHVAPELAEIPVSIEGLIKEYSGGYRAVNGVSFRVEAGQVVGLLGPNGAGKTTVLRVLVGLMTPTAGTVHVFGDPVYPGAPVLARLGAFIEGPGFLPHLSGLENLHLFWAATGRPPSEAMFDTALDIAGLGTSIDRRVRHYSHGMKQRLGIAQAMLGLPEVLVLDEPTNGLDPPQIAEMREVLQRYAETGRTVIVSSHLLAEVEQTCTHVVVMHKGRLVAAGSVADIAGAGGMQLLVADPARAAEVLEAAGISTHLVPAQRALEDVFLDLVGGAE